MYICGLWREGGEGGRVGVRGIEREREIGIWNLEVTFKKFCYLQISPRTFSYPNLHH